MSFIQIFAIAVALAMDAFAVSIATGVTLKQIHLRQTFRLAWHFGFFQAMMPVIGWGTGLTVRSFIERFDHWVAFGLLAFVGGNMIREAFAYEKEARKPADPTRGSLTLQMLLLGGVFIGSTVFIFGGIAMMAGTLGGWLNRSPKTQVIMNRVAGTVFVALALKLATTSR